MVKTGFLHFTSAPTDDAAEAIPLHVDPPSLEKCSKTMVLFHDESTFQANDNQSLLWGQKDEKPKSKGAEVMVSDFIDKHNGVLVLTDEEH